ncbi:hypothetical protein JCM11641_006726 [Rhodosporidiobolus odoratus]
MSCSHPTPQSTRTRNLVLVLGSILSLTLLTSLSAHHNSGRSKSALRVTHYLPATLTSLNNPLLALDYPQSRPTLPGQAGVQDDELDPLAYRRFLEQSTSPRTLTTHSTALGFDHIYVLSLPSRLDRRKDMTKLARALGVRITFVDAADKHEPFIRWIAEQVYDSREERKKVMARARHTDSSTVGGLSPGSDWLTPFPNAASSTDRFPPFPSSPLYPNARNWVEHLETLYSRHDGAHIHLRPSDDRLNVTELLWDPLERVAVRQVHEGVISTYWGQTRAIKRMLENKDRTALILEDDVDLEWDVERLWKLVKRRLPEGETGEADWDVAFLGHCWGGEFQKPQYLNPLLHPSTGPMCLHGYALTSTGAQTLLSYMLDPWSAYSAAVDLVVPSLLHIQDTLPPSYPPLLRSFTLNPPLVVQRKEGPSDLQKGNGSKWRGLLRDSTMERVRRDEGVWHEGWEEERDKVGEDPATRLRCGPV